MKVLLVNTSERIGGAAIATNRLLRALNNNGVKAKMLVRDRQTDRSDVVYLPRTIKNNLYFVFERAGIFFTNRFSKRNLWALDTAAWGADITKLPEFKEADIVHLNWINQGMVSLPIIRKILKSGKPVVWTLHDMWPFTGICHHAESCTGWLTGCGDCPQLCHPADDDLSSKVFRNKAVAYSEGSLHIVACSQWLADLARRSPLFKEYGVSCIQNAIDTQFYHPGNKLEARKALGLPEEKQLLLFVAYKATDRKKGIDYLIEATNIISEQHPEWSSLLGVIPVGLEAESLKDAFACEAYPQDYVTDPARMRLLYQAADLLVMPTLMDNLPNTIVEAMSCALPCVGFNIGGLPQMIQDGINGRLARYRDAEHFAQLTLETLVSANYKGLCKNAHDTAVAQYSEQTVANRYIKLYEDCLKGRKKDN